MHFLVFDSSDFIGLKEQIALGSCVYLVFFNPGASSVLKNLAKFARLIMLQFCHKPKKEEYSFNSFSTSSMVRSPMRTRSGRLVKQPTRFVL